jgi:hypothetical protein
MTPTQAASSRAELADYLSCCRANGYEPTEADVRGIITFLLLLNSSGSASAMCESLEELPLWAAAMLEAHGRGSFRSDTSDDFQFFGSGAGHGAAKSVSLQPYIEYIFKRPRLMGLFKREMTLEFSRLDLFEEEVAIRKKLAELEGREPEAKIDFPKMTR